MSVEASSDFAAEPSSSFGPSSHRCRHPELGYVDTGPTEGRCRLLDALEIESATVAGFDWGSKLTANVLSCPACRMVHAVDWLFGWAACPTLT